MEEGSSKARPNRRLWLGAAAALALSLAILALFAWPHGDGSSGPLNVVAEAAAKTQSQPGGRAAIRTVITPTDSDPFAMRGGGAFDGAGGVHMTLTMRRPDNGRLVKIDYGSAMELDGPLPSSGNVKGELALLETVGDDVRKLGREKVRGVETTRYRGTLDPSEEAQKLLDLGSEDFATKVQEEGSPVQVEAWIDGDELVRRMRIVSSQPKDEGKGEISIDVSVDFFDFGYEPEIEAPDSSEVFDATSLASS